MEFDERLADLASGPVYRFADWPNPEVPVVAAGVYAVWAGDGAYLYVGMSGRGLTERDLAARSGGRTTGLWTRLNSHAAGRRSGDQFCVYVADRLVLPTLSSTVIEEIAAGVQSFDALVRSYIRAHLSYRFVTVPSGRAALELEHLAAAGGLDGKLPLLNPR
jgi:hypothetical protein